MARGLACTMLTIISSALATVAMAQVRVQSPADPYLYEQTGFAFPARVATGVRHYVTRYDTDGSDLGVDYQIARNGRMIAFVSLFVYPAPSLPVDTPATRAAACAGEFANIKRNLLSHEPMASLTREEEIAARPGPMPPRGWRATYIGGRTKFDGAEQDVREQAELFCHVGGKWLVAYRITSLASVDPGPEIQTFLDTLRWPVSLQN